MNHLSFKLDLRLSIAAALRTVNLVRWRRFLAHTKISKTVILVVVPGLEHLCIPCVRLLSPFFTVILIDNGLPTPATQWLTSALPQIPIFSLITTVKGAGKHVLSHGKVLDLLTRIPITAVFADPDCYVFHPELIAKLFRSLETNAIASLYADPSILLGFRIPDTFCFGVQAKSLSALRKSFNVRLGDSVVLTPRLLDAAVQVWGSPVPFPDPNKAFFDTIHSLAIATYLAGMGLDVIPFSQGQVHHVLATSYCIKNLQDARFDINVMILNAQYFHCLISEQLASPPPNYDVRNLITYYGGSKELLEKFPGYALSRLRTETQDLVSALLLRNACFIESNPLGV